MITGTVNRDGDLIAPVRVLDANEYVHRFEAVVDTGFSGYLSLSPRQIRDMGLGPPQPIDMVVANNVTFETSSYPGIVLWRGERRPVQIIESEGTPLIGIALLWGSLLTAEITDNGNVAIGPLPAEISG